ncbi:MAG TPA: hypothetical protein VN253_02670, partial [Kofleriaceae bacterium]|nr:hypothetical protein [Kofleriaceae bacterium]
PAAVTPAPAGAPPAALPRIHTRRPVAVIALADDPQAEAFANLLGTTLVNHGALAPLEPGSMIGALVGEFVDEYRDKIASAEGTRVRAEKALSDFVFPVAVSTAQAGHESLHTVIPSTHAVALYSDLALIVAKAKLGEGRQAEAARFFGLVHQLTPGRRLDPALHLPEVVAAYEAARTGLARTGTLVVKGSGRVWVDGKDQDARTQFLLPAGLHVVWLTGPDRETVGRQVFVEADQENIVDLGEAPASIRLRVQRARIALRNAPDPAARAAAMRRLADLLAVHDAVLITMPAGKLIVQTWHDKPEGDLLPGFSAHRLALGEQPTELLRPLAPPPTHPRPARPRPLPDVEKEWYRRRPVQASIAAGVLGVVIGSIVLARRLQDRTVRLDGDTIFLPTLVVR